ncbi:MAG: hypothetical protein JSS91_13405 [Bacteroidetes bacterium]|nr:hypothetical protein [Bacteroidota bacterium]
MLNSINARVNKDGIVKMPALLRFSTEKNLLITTSDYKNMMLAIILTALAQPSNSNNRGNNFK